MCGFTVLTLAAQGLAVDRYIIELPKAAMIGDTGLTLNVIPASEEKSNSVIPIAFVSLPSGVRVEPVDISLGMAVKGPTSFKLILGAGTSPGFVSIKVKSATSKKIQGQGGLFVQPTVSRFAISPVGTVFGGKIGDPLTLQIKALGADGTVVTAFRDLVDIWVSKGSLDISEIDGSQFSEGIAQFTVRFDDADPVSHLNELTVQCATTYAGQSERASGTYRVALSAAGRSK